MSFRNRFGHFIALGGAISLFVFWASLYTPEKKHNYPAFFIGIILLWIGLPMRRSKRPAPPPAAPPPPAPAKPAPDRPAAPKKQGLLTTLLKGPPPKTTAPPRPPPPAAPPPPPPKKGLAALFAPKPKKK